MAPNVCRSYINFLGKFREIRAKSLTHPIIFLLLQLWTLESTNTGTEHIQYIVTCQQTLHDSEPYFPQCFPPWLNPAGLRVHQGKQQINMLRALTYVSVIEHCYEVALRIYSNPRLLSPLWDRTISGLAGTWAYFCHSYAHKCVWPTGLSLKAAKSINTVHNSFG